MAFSRSVLGIKWDMGKYTMEPLPPWAGPISPPFRDPRFREVSKNAGYLDFVAVLKPAEVLEMAGSETGHSLAGRASRDPLEKALRGVTFVMVHIWEWESPPDRQRSKGVSPSLGTSA